MEPCCYESLLYCQSLYIVVEAVFVSLVPSHYFYIFEKSSLPLFNFLLHFSSHFYHVELPL